MFLVGLLVFMFGWDVADWVASEHRRRAATKLAERFDEGYAMGLRHGAQDARRRRRLFVRRVVDFLGRSAAAFAVGAIAGLAAAAIESSR